MPNSLIDGGKKGKEERAGKSSESHENSRISYSERIGKLHELQETSYERFHRQIRSLVSPSHRGTGLLSVWYVQVSAAGGKGDENVIAIATEIDINQTRKGNVMRPSSYSVHLVCSWN